MRARALLLAALAALAACSVATEGAPCRDAVSCPVDQACGADLRCSAKALACTRCMPGETACVSGGVATCAVAADGVCADFANPVAPGPHQRCDAPSPGVAQLACVPSACSVSGSVCVGALAEQPCDVDAAGCLYPTGEPQACLGIATCAGVDGQGKCQCPAPALHAGGGCATAGDVSCDAAKRSVLECKVDAASGCRAWSARTDCSTGAAVPGLVCGGPASAEGCVCPAAGTTAYVDAGRTAVPGLLATGAASPAACRFGDLTPIATAPAKSTVVVTGAPQIFTDAPPLVPAGVTLTTESALAPETKGQWVLELSRPLVLGEGATLSGSSSGRHPRRPPRSTPSRRPARRSRRPPRR